MLHVAPIVYTIWLGSLTVPAAHSFGLLLLALLEKIVFLKTIIAFLLDTPFQAREIHAWSTKPQIRDVAPTFYKI